MVPAAYAYKTGGFQHPIFTRESGSSSTRRGFQHLIFTRQSGSSSLCLQDRWVPAPNVYEGGLFQQLTAWGPALLFYETKWFRQLVPTRQMDSSTHFLEGGRLQQHTAWVPALNCHEGQCFQRLRPRRQMGASTRFLRGRAVPAAHGVGSSTQLSRGAVFQQPAAQTHAPPGQNFH